MKKTVIALVILVIGFVLDFIIGLGVAWPLLTGTISTCLTISNLKNRNELNLIVLFLAIVYLIFGISKFIVF